MRLSLSWKWLLTFAFAVLCGIAVALFLTSDSFSPERFRADVTGGNQELDDAINDKALNTSIACGEVGGDGCTLSLEPGEQQLGEIGAHQCSLEEYCVSCAAGYYWNGADCVQGSNCRQAGGDGCTFQIGITENGITDPLNPGDYGCGGDKPYCVACTVGTVWNGINCIPPRGAEDENCEPGYTWDGERCSDGSEDGGDGNGNDDGGNDNDGDGVDDDEAEAYCQSVNYQDGGGSFTQIAGDLQPVPLNDWTAETLANPVPTTNIIFNTDDPNAPMAQLTVRNNSASTTYEIELNAYKVFDVGDGTGDQDQPFIETQEPFGHDWHTLLPGEEVTLEAPLPDCAYQVVFYVDTLPDNDATLLLPPKFPYQDRLQLLDWKGEHSNLCAGEGGGDGGLGATIMPPVRCANLGDGGDGNGNTNTGDNPPPQQCIGDPASQSVNFSPNETWEVQNRNTIKVRIPNMEVGKYYRTLTINFDYRTPPTLNGSANDLMPIFALFREKLTANDYFWVWAANNYRKTGIDFIEFHAPQGTEKYFNFPTNWQPNTDYHIEAISNAEIGRTTITISQNGNVIGERTVDTILNRADIVDKGPGLFIGFGDLLGNQNPEYFSPIGARYSNLRVNLEPGGPYCQGLQGGTVITGACSEVNISTRAPITAPLRVSPSNPHFFVDGNGDAVYLTGSHTWNNVQDWGASQPNFNNNAYLDLLQQHNHNFIRLWMWEANKLNTGATVNINPNPWKRTGPGTANDGGPKYDLTQFDNAYFSRLTDRIQAAQQRNMYVSVMLFQYHTTWEHNPFNLANNINGVDAKGRDQLHTMSAGSAAHDMQKAYVRKVVDTVNSFNNVLYDVGNEISGAGLAWQDMIVDTVKQYQQSKPKQHLIGINTCFGNTCSTTQELLNTSADWVALSWSNNSYDPPIITQKPVISDTDHIRNILTTSDSGLKIDWAWKSFMRGMHAIHMEATRHGIPGHEGKSWNDVNNPAFPAARVAMGNTLFYADRLDLGSMRPSTNSCSTGYCLTSSDEYLVYAPSGGTFTVNLSGFSGPMYTEWMNVGNGEIRVGDVVDGGATRSFTSPFSGAAVLYVVDNSLTDKQFVAANTATEKSCSPGGGGGGNGGGGGGNGGGSGGGGGQQCSDECSADVCADVNTLHRCMDIDNDGCLEIVEIDCGYNDMRCLQGDCKIVFGDKPPIPDLDPAPGGNNPTPGGELGPTIDLDMP